MGPVRTTIFGVFVVIAFIMVTSAPGHGFVFMTANAVTLMPKDPEPFTATIPEPDLSNCPSGRVALTFDDGPVTKNTPKLLKVLRDNKAQATFYVVGYRMKANPQIVKQAFADGHAIENHSWDHPRFDRLNAAKINKQMSKTSAMIVKHTKQMPVSMRPPYGIHPKRVHKQATKNNMSVELWSIDTNDWKKGRSTQSIKKSALKQLKKNKANVILMHDGVKNSHKTVAAVAGIIKGARERGYCVVRLDQLGPQPAMSIADTTVIRPVQGEAQIEVQIVLDKASPRYTSLTLTPISDTAVRDQDFESKAIQIVIPAGKQQATAQIKVFADPSSSDEESFTLRLEHARGLIFPTTPPRVTLVKE